MRKLTSASTATLFELLHILLVGLMTGGNNYILVVRKVGHLDIKTKMSDFQASVLIGWLTNTLASQPTRTRTCGSISESNIFVFILRWPTFLTASIVLITTDIKYSPLPFLLRA